jgi:hypothetical protein
MQRLLLRSLVIAALVFIPASPNSQAAAAVAMPPGSITVPSSGTFLYMNSQPGDYIGAGAEALYTRADTDIVGSLQPGGDYFRGRAIQSNYVHWWYVDIAAPAGQPLAVGSYSGAFRAAFRPAGSPGLDFSGDGRGCNTLTGQFDITELSFDPVGGELLRFDATFEQHCEGGSAALFGRLRIENQAPTPGVTLPAGSITVPTSGSFLYMNSQSGDYIGGGQEQLYTGADSAVNGSLQQGPDYFSANVIQGSYVHWWYVDIAAPRGVPLAVGSYIRATRAAFRSAGSPGIDVSGDGRGCNTITGKFDVNELTFWPSGDLRVFQATFEQHCEGFTPALFGRIRVEAAQPAPPLQFGVALRGDGTITKTAVATVSGTVSCSRSVPVDLDGTLSQVVANRATITGNFSAHVDCVAPSTKWSATAMASNGRFNSGSASVSVNAGACEGSKCYFASAAANIKLNSSK